MSARFYVPPAQWGEGVLGEEESRHLSRVLRLKPGADIELFDGKGRVAEAQVASAGQKQVTFQQISEKFTEPLHPKITLLQAVPKGKRMDLIIQKAAELGVTQIIPLVTQNTVAQPGSPEKKAEKWQRLVLEACKQCKQPWLPLIHAPRPLSTGLMSPERITAPQSLRLVASLHGNAERFREVIERVSPHPQEITLLIGPEGDFSREELDAAEAASFQPVSLGPLVLRVETATISALSALRFFYY